MPEGSQPWGSGRQLVLVHASRSFQQSYNLHLLSRVPALRLGWAYSAVWGEQGESGAPQPKPTRASVHPPEAGGAQGTEGKEGQLCHQV